MLEDNNDHKINFVSADERIRQEAWTREKTLNDYYSDMFNAREEGIQEGIEKERMNIIKNLKAMGLSQKDIDRAVNGLSL